MLFKYGLLAYLLLNFALIFVLPSYRVWRRTGISPITFSNSDNAHDYVGNVFKVLLILLLAVVLIHSFFAENMRYMLPIWYLEKPGLRWAGVIILGISLLWIALAQYQMSDSWRIGIDEKNKTSLVTQGIFHISRNPIFLGMMVTLLGVFLVIPNALTFMILTTGFIVMQIQVRLEEEFLKRVHGEAYQSYCRATRRWI